MSAVEQRCEILRERITTEHGPTHGFLFAAVVCNGCGMTVSAPTPELLARLLNHWRLGGFGEDSDYCPSCLG